MQFQYFLVHSHHILIPLVVFRSHRVTLFILPPRLILFYRQTVFRIIHFHHFQTRSHTSFHFHIIILIRTIEIRTGPFRPASIYKRLIAEHINRLCIFKIQGYSRCFNIFYPVRNLVALTRNQIFSSPVTNK